MACTCKMSLQYNESSTECTTLLILRTTRYMEEQKSRYTFNEAIVNVTIKLNTNVKLYNKPRSNKEHIIYSPVWLVSTFVAITFSCHLPHHRGWCEG